MLAPTPRHPARIFQRCENRAFSLIEIVLSLGIIAFAVVPMVGLLGTGLTSAKNSTTNLAVSNIARTLRADLQASPWGTYTVSTQYYYYFSDGGYPITDGTHAAGVQWANPPGALYQAVVSPQLVVIPLPMPTPPPSSSALVCLVTVTYPYPSTAQSNVFSLFIAQ